MAKNKITLIYTYKRRYAVLESLLERLPSYFNVVAVPVISVRAKAFSIAAVPAIVAIDTNGVVAVKKEGFALVKAYLNQFVADA